MTDIAIRVENPSKRYRIGKAQQRHDTLRDALVDGFLPRIAQIARMGRKEKVRGNLSNPWPATEGILPRIAQIARMGRKEKVRGNLSNPWPVTEGILPRIAQIARMGRKEKVRGNPPNPWPATRQ